MLYNVVLEELTGHIDSDNIGWYKRAKLTTVLSKVSKQKAQEKLQQLKETSPNNVLEAWIEKVHK